MVLEFDKMQGTAGGYYAANERLSDEVANAIKSHYLPKFAGDSVPQSNTACAVALADRLDTLTGIFGIGQEPSGSKDPFALRRASIGILQIILQNELTLNIDVSIIYLIALPLSTKIKVYRLKYLPPLKPTP
jgi:glycyl-tRNA synthetase beta chain